MAIRLATRKHRIGIAAVIEAIENARTERRIVTKRGSDAMPLRYRGRK